MSGSTQDKEIMSFIPILGVDAASVESPLRELRGVFAHFPDGLAAFDQMYARMVGKGRLDLALRLVIIGSSARWRSDPYIAGTMFTQAMHEGLAATALAELIEETEGDEPTSPEAVLLSFCRKVTQTAYKTIPSDMEKLRASGWTNGQIVEAVTMVSLSGYMSAMSAAGGLLAEPNVEAEPWR